MPIKELDSIEEIKPDNDGFPKEGFGNLNAPPGYAWTDKWKHGPTIRRDQMQRMRANEAGRIGWQNGTPVYNPPGAPDISYTEPGADPEWDYRTAKVGPSGEVLPKRAVGFDPRGRVDYGTTWGVNLWNQILDRSEEAVENKFGHDRVEHDDVWYEKLWQSQFGKYSLIRTGVGITGDIAQKIFDPVTMTVQRLLGTQKLTADELAEEAEIIPDITGKIQEVRRDVLQPEIGLRELLPEVLRNMPEVTPREKPIAEWLFDFIESVEFYPWDVLRTAEGTLRTLGKGTTLKDIWETAISNEDSNWQASRMFYSIGSNDKERKARFMERVMEGEDPRMVAIDLEQPLSQLLGYFAYDPLNLIDIYAKTTQTATRLGRAASEVAEFTHEFQVVAEAFSTLDKAGDVSDIAKIQAVDDIFPVLRGTINRIRAGVEKLAGAKGIFTRTGSAKRVVASQRIGLFGGGVVAMVDTPDDVADVFINMARLYSDNDSEVRIAIEYLSKVLDPQFIFSEAGLEFAHFMATYLDDAGQLNPARYLNSVQEFIDNGDIVGLGKKTLDDLEAVTSKMFPTIDELIRGEKRIKDGEKVTVAIQNFFDEGGRIRTIDRLINRGVNQSALGKFQKNVSGRAFIGMRADVATRGIMWDTLQSTIDLGASVNINSPTKWAEISELWIGFEHAGLTQGFSKADIVQLDQLATKNTSYKDMGSLLDAVLNKGMDAAEIGATKKFFETVTNPGGRAMQWFEMKSSQRVIGKSVDQAMRHLIKKTMPKLDELVLAGLSEDVAKGLTQRLIYAYGDTAAVEAVLLGEISNGFIDTFKHMDWLPDNIKGILNDFNVLDEVEQVLVAGGSKDEVLTSLRNIADNLLSRTDDVARQHAEIAVTAFDEGTDMGTAFGGMAEATEAGAVSIDDFSEMKNHYQANRNVVARVNEALKGLERQLVSQANNTLQGAEQTDAINEIQTVFSNISDPLDRFAEVTGNSSNASDAAWEFTRMLEDTDNSLADIRQAIMERFGFSDEALESVKNTRPAIKDFMWKRWKQDYRVRFSGARAEAVDKLLGIIPEISGSIDVTNHPLIEAVIKAEEVAKQMDTAVMVDGVMKPVGSLIRAYENLGENANAARGVASLLDPSISSFRAGDATNDTRILRIVNEFSGSQFDNLADVPAEDVFNAFRNWREGGGFETIVNSLDEVAGYSDEILELADITHVNPPVDDIPDQVFGRDVLENKPAIETAFQTLYEQVEQNFGAGVYIDAEGQNITGLVGAVNDWFGEASKRVIRNKATSASYAQYMRDFVLHNYADRLGVDALMSLWSNFHFWPSRTLAKWAQRVPYNLAIIHKYMQYKDALEKLHADQPEWYRYSLNSDELLGIETNNPVLINLERAINPFSDMMGGFDNPKKRVNWYSTLLDGISQVGIGFPTPIIQYAVAMGLKIQGEDEAAAFHGGRFLPISRQAKGATALLGVNEGRGVELDPSIRAFSDANFFDFTGRHVGPYEEKRVANALSQIALENPDIPEQAYAEAWTHGGPLWDEAIARSAQKDAVGSLFSAFTGVGAKYQTEDDIKINRFWQEYSILLSSGANINPVQFRNEYEAIMEKYPFAPFMLLARKGGEERDQAYAYAVLSRIAPSMSDDVSKAAGFDYDIVADFYDNKGDFSEMNIKDSKKFMIFISELGTTLAVPENATRDEWNAASARYKEMLKFGKQIFGEFIWDRVDAGYNLKDTGFNQSNVWNEYLRANPDIEQAMDWKSQFVLEDPILAAYYGSQDKLRSYWTGGMYETLEMEFGEDIWLKLDIYMSFVKSGLKEEAKVYRKENNLSAYYDRKAELNEVISEAMVTYGDKLPEGESTRLREDLPEDLSAGEQDIIEFITAPKLRNYTQGEWRGIVGNEAMQVAILIWEGVDMPPDVVTHLQGIAESLGMTYQELITSIGQADR